MSTSIHKLNLDLMEKLEKSKGKDTEQAAKPDDDSHIQSFSHAGSLL